MLIALFTTLGIGSIAAAWIARLTAISSFRQAWINALRDDFAEFLRLQNVVYQYSVLRSSAASIGDQSNANAYALNILEAQNATLFLNYRIITRLNRTDFDHRTLVRRLTEVTSSQESAETDPIAVKAAVEAAQAVFKREWEVTKYGVFAGLMTAIRSHLRLTFSLHPRQVTPVIPVTTVMLPASKVERAALEVWIAREKGHKMPESRLNRDRTDLIATLYRMAGAAARSDPSLTVAITVEQFRWLQSAYDAS